MKLELDIPDEDVVLVALALRQQGNKVHDSKEYTDPATGLLIVPEFSDAEIIEFYLYKWVGQQIDKGSYEKDMEVVRKKQRELRKSMPDRGVSVMVKHENR